MMSSSSFSKKAVFAFVIGLLLMALVLFLLSSKTPLRQADPHRATDYSATAHVESRRVTDSSATIEVESSKASDSSETIQVERRSAIDDSVPGRTESRSALPLITQSETPQLRAIAVGIQDGLQDLVILDADLQPVGELSLREFAFSSAFSAPIVDGKLIFGVADGVDDAGNNRFKPVAAVNWKDSYQPVCLLFIPKGYVGKNESTYEYVIQTLDMGEGFKLGHVKVINLTPLEAMVRMGEHQRTIQPWAASDIPEITEVSELNMLQLNVFYKYKDTVHTAKNSRMRYLESVRYITLIYPDVENKRVDVKTITDYGKLY